MEIVREEAQEKEVENEKQPEQEVVKEVLSVKSEKVYLPFDNLTDKQNAISEVNALVNVINCNIQFIHFDGGNGNKIQPKLTKSTSINCFHNSEVLDLAKVRIEELTRRIIITN